MLARLMISRAISAVRVAEELVLSVAVGLRYVSAC